MKNNMAALFILSLVLAMNLISIAEAEKHLGLYYGDTNCRKLARRISCSTLDGSVKLCPVIENLPILTVRLAKERTPNSCIFGSSYGIATGVIWVAGKCQGIFNTISCLDPSENKSIEEEDSSEIEVNSSSNEMDDHSGIAQAFNEKNLTKIAEAWLDKHFRPEEYDQLYELLVALMNKNASYELIDELYPTTSTSKQESQESRPDPNSQNRREKKTLKNILMGTTSGISRRFSPTLKNLWKKFGVDIDEKVLELSSKEYLSAETSTKSEEFKSQSEEDDNQTKPRITRDVDPAKKFVSGVVDKFATTEKHDSEEDHDEESKYINSESLNGRGTSVRYEAGVHNSKYNNDDFDGDDMEEKDETSSLVGDSRSEVQNDKGGELEDVKSVDDSEKEAQTETEQTKETHSKERNETELSREITAEKENLDTSEGSSENKTLGKLDRRLPTKDGKQDHEYTKSNLQVKSKIIPESESVDKEGQREKSDDAKDQRNAGILNAVKDKRNANGQIKTDNEIADDTPSTKSFGSLGMDPTEDISERKTPNKLMSISLTDSKGKQNCTTRISDAEKAEFDDREKQNENKKIKGLNLRLSNLLKWHNKIAAADKMGKAPGLWGSGYHFDLQQYPNGHETATRIRREAGTDGKSSNKLMNKNPIASKGKQNLLTTKSGEENEDFDERDDQNERKIIKGLNLRLSNVLKKVSKPRKQISRTDSQGVRVLSKKLSHGEKQGMAKRPNLLDDDDEDDSIPSKMSGSGYRLYLQKYTNDHKKAGRSSRESATVGKSSRKLMNKNPIASKGKQNLSMMKSEEEKEDYDESDDLDESNNNKSLNKRLPNMQKSKVTTTGKPGKQISGTDSQVARDLSKKLSGQKQGITNLHILHDDEEDEDDSKSSTQSSSVSRLNSQEYANDHKTASRIRPEAETVGKSSNKVMNKNPIASKGKRILSTMKSEEEKEDFDESDDLDESNNNKGLNKRLPNMQKSKVATTGKPRKQISGTDAQVVRGLSKKLTTDKEAMVKLPNSLDDEDDEDDSTSATQSGGVSRLNSQKYANDHKTASRIRRAAATVGKSSNKVMNKNPIASKGKQILSTMKSEEEKEDFDESDDLDESNNNKGLNKRLPNMQKSKVATTGKPGKQVSRTDAQVVRGLSKKLSADKKGKVKFPNSLDDEDDEDDSTSATQSGGVSRLNSQKYANNHKTASRTRPEAATVGKSSNKLMNKNRIASKGKQNLSMMKSEEEKDDFDECDHLDESKNNKDLNKRLPNMQKSKVATTGKPGKQISGTDAQVVRGLSKKLSADKKGKVKFPNSLDDEDDEDDSTSATQSGGVSRLNSQKYANDHKTASRIRRAAATVGKSSNKVMNENPIVSKGNQILSTMKSEEEKEDFDESDDLDESNNNEGLNKRLPNMQKSKVATTGKPGKQISGTDAQVVRSLSKKLSADKKAMVKLPNSLDDEDDEDDSTSATQSGGVSRLNSQKYANDHKTASRIRRATANVGKLSKKLVNKNRIASKGKQILSTMKSEEEKDDFDESDDLDESNNNKGLNKRLPNMQKPKVATTGKPGKQISGTDAQVVRSLSNKLKSNARQGMAKLRILIDYENDDDDSNSSAQSSSASRLNSQEYANDHKTASRIRREAETVRKSSNNLMNKNPIPSNGKQNLSTTKSEEEKEDFDESDDLDESNNNKGLNKRPPNMQKSKVATTGKPGKQISGTDVQGVRGLSKKLSADKQAMLNLSNSLDDEDDEDESTSATQSGDVSHLNSQEYANDNKTASRIRRAAATVGKSSNKVMNKNRIATKGKQNLSTMKSEEEKDDFDESDDLDESNNNKGLNKRLPNMQKPKVATTGKPGKQISGTDAQVVRSLSNKLKSNARQGMAKLRILIDYENDDDDSNSSAQSSSASRLNSQEYANDHKTASRIRREAETVRKLSNNLMNKNPIPSNGKQNVSTTKSEEEKEDFDESDDLDESNNNKGLNKRLPNMQKSKVATTGKPGKQISGTDVQGVRGLSKKLSADKQAMLNLSNSLDDEDDEDDSTSATQSGDVSHLNSQEYANDNKTASRIRRAAATVGKSSNKLINKNRIASKGKQILSTMKSEEEKDFDESDDLDESNNNKGLNKRLPNMQKPKVATTGKPGKQISGTDAQVVRSLSNKLKSNARQGMAKLRILIDYENDDDDSNSSAQSSSASRLNSQEYANDHKTASRIRREAETVRKLSNNLMNKNPIPSNGKQNVSTTKSEEEKEDFDESDDLDESNNNKGLNKRLPNMQKSKVATTGKPGKQISGTDVQGVRGLSKKLSADKQAMLNLPNSLDDEDDEDDSTSATQSGGVSRLNSQKYANDHKTASRIRQATANVGKSSKKLVNKNRIASKGKQNLSTMKSEEEKEDFDESDDLDESNNNKGLNKRLPNMQKSKVATTGKPGKQISGPDAQDVRGLSKKLSADKQAMLKLSNSLDDEDDEDDSTSATQSGDVSHLNSQEYANDHKTASRIRRAAATVGKSSNKLMNKNPIASKGKQILSTMKSEEEKEDFDESDDLDESNNNKGLNKRLPNMQKSKVATTGKPGKQISATDAQVVRGLSKKVSADKKAMVKLPNSLDDEDDEDDSTSATQSGGVSRLNSQKYANDHKTASRIRQATANVGKSSKKLVNKNRIASKGKQNLSTMKSEEEKEDFDESDDLDESNNNKGLNKRLPNMKKSRVATTGKPGKQISGPDAQDVRGLSKKLSADKQAMLKLSNSFDDEDDEDDSTSATQSGDVSHLNSQEYANDHKTASRIRRAAATVGKSSNKLMNKNPIASKGKQILSTMKSEEEKEDFDESDDLDESNNNKGLNKRLPNMQKSKVATTGKPGKQISATDAQVVRGLSKKVSADKKAMVKLPNSLDDEDDEDDSTSATQSGGVSRLNSQKYANDHKTASRIRQATANVGKSSKKLVNKNRIASKGKQNLSTMKSEEEKEDFDESDDLDESNNNKGLNKRLPNMKKSRVATTGKPGKQISGPDAQDVRGLSKKLSADKQAMLKLSNSLDDEDDEDDSTSATQSGDVSHLNSQEYANDHKTASRIRRAAATVGKSSNKLMNKNPIASKGKQILSTMKSEEEKDFDESDDLDESNNNKGLNKRLPNMQKSKVATTGKPGKQISATDAQVVRGLSKKLSADKKAMVKLPNSLDDEDDEDDSTSATQSGGVSRLNSQKYANDHKTVSRIRQATANVGKSSKKLVNKNRIASKGKQNLSTMKSEEEKEDFDESNDLDESNNNKGLNKRLPNMQKSKVATTGKPGKQISGTDSQGFRVLFKKLRSGAKQGKAKLPILLNDEDDDDDSKSSTQSNSGSRLDMGKYTNDHKMASRIRREALLIGKAKIGIVGLLNRPIKKKVNLPLPPDLRGTSNVLHFNRKKNGVPSK